MKRGTFRKVSFTMDLYHIYGHYVIKANYRGKKIKTITTDSEAWDWIDDESNKKKYNEARKHCYNKIVSSYKAIYSWF